METLKIEIPEGYEVESFDKDNGEIKFKSKEKTVFERITTIEEVLEDHGMTMKAVDKMFSKAPEHLKYQYIAELLCESLNEGWQPEWSNINENKYYPWFEMNGSSGFRFLDGDHWFTASPVGSRLCVKSRDLCNHIGEHFTDLYQKFMIINY